MKNYNGALFDPIDERLPNGRGGLLCTSQMGRKKHLEVSQLRTKMAHQVVLLILSLKYWHRKLS